MIDISENSIKINTEDYIHEECGIFGIISSQKDDIAQDIYYGLFSLQHRGQESAGIAVSYDYDKIAYYKNMGLVSEVFGKEELSLLPKSNLGIGHVRYSTTGSSNVVNAQPVVFYGRYGRMAIAHNGNIVNADKIKINMIEKGYIFQSSIDSEVIAAYINYCANDNLQAGIIEAAKTLKGSFALVIMAQEKLYALRDPYGLKPLIMGKRDNKYIFASESCALDSIDAEIIRDVKPGEIITIDKCGRIESNIYCEKPHRPCIFEYVYLSRSDSMLDGKSVYEFRYECGKKLASLLKIDADIVSGVPDSAVVSALGYSEESGIPYADAISKNRYIGRTFIQPSQSQRESSVKIKLNAFKNNIKGKRLILIDDSIVRGTTSKKIIKLLRQNGAKEVHMVVCSPMIKYPCYFGVDMQTKEQLLANNKSLDEIREYIEADSLHYIPLEVLVETCCTNENKNFCTGCFNGQYAFDLLNMTCDKLGLE